MKKILLASVLAGGLMVSSCTTTQLQQAQTIAQQILGQVVAYTTTACAFEPTLVMVTTAINQGIGTTVAAVGGYICGLVNSGQLKPVATANGNARVALRRGRKAIYECIPGTSMCGWKS